MAAAFVQHLFVSPSGKMRRLPFCPPLSPKKEKGSLHGIRRIRLNHPDAQFRQACFGTFFGVEDAGLHDVHVSCGLRTGLVGLHSELLGERRQVGFSHRLFVQHGERSQNILKIPTLFSCVFPLLFDMK
jgi:hypothetical protein